MNVNKFLLTFVLHSCLLTVFCQKEMGDTDLGCPRGTYKLDNFCYSISSLSGNFDDSELSCEMGGGRLAMVKSPEVHLFLHKIRIRRYLLNYWVGLNDKVNEGIWVYSDGSRVQGYSRWAPGEPNNAKGQHCGKIVMSKNLLWDDDQCNNKWLYICQFDGANCTEEKPSFGTFCFELSIELATYDQAAEQCRFKGGYLVNIKTPSIYEFIKSLIHRERKWLELTETDVANILRMNNNRIPAIWIGVRYFKGKWIYSDDTVTDFTNWAPGEPNNAKTEEDCVLMSQQWHDVKCDTIRNFACQYNVSKPIIDPVMEDFITDDGAWDIVTTTTDYVINSEPSIGANTMVHETGLKLGVNHFASLLLVFFVLGAMFVACFWGIATYSKNVKSRIIRRRKSDDQTLRILDHDVNNQVFCDKM